MLTRRRYGCALDALGLDLHLHDVRSYEKLTSDEAAVLAAAADALRAGPAHHGPMGDVWRDAGTLRVARREPHATSAAKVLPCT